ncbi:Regulator of rDNA transcription protein 15 [Capsicum annuum]|uniref:Regulator of rDNA transcription protein 15 n=1 Tax=Capsicum annuum TaxID=4072 RepID=A0A2G2XTW9_CAPAN|nr:Regulator of rDNA transcription protein 15 [Capsicum annuum]
MVRRCLASLCHVSMVPWCHDALVHGATMPWCLGAMVLRFLGAMMPLCHGVLVPRCLHALVSWCVGSLCPWRFGCDGASARISNLAKTLPWSKGSLGHALMVRIRTRNQNQTSFYPSGPHDISVLVELILGHLRSLLIDVPPQPNSLPNNVFCPDRPANSKLAIRCTGKASEGTVPSPSPDRHAVTRSRYGRSSSSTPTTDGFGTGISVPSPQC